MDMVLGFTKFDEMVKVKDLKPSKFQRNKHTKEQIERLALIMAKHKVRHPIHVSKQSGQICFGHGRLAAAKKNKWKEFPVVYQDFASDDEEYACVQSDNAIALWAELDMAHINLDMENLGPDFDIDLLGIKDFTLEPAEKYMAEHGQLSDKFGAPPFTILDTRQGYWVERKREWETRGINSADGRDANLMGTPERPDFFKSGFKSSAPDTSVFDPVLCELMYKWFSPEGGVIIDPFAGGSVRGIVAAMCGRHYVGIDLRQEQVNANNRQAADICKGIKPLWVKGDSVDIKNLSQNTRADFVFTCPPYFDLEQYSDDPKDLSNMTWGDFLTSYRKIIKESCDLLANDSFACFVVGEVRDKDGNYLNFVGETVKAFLDAGLKLYNEAILVNQFGTAAMRASKTFGAARKLIKCHQNVLVFVKGTAKAATAKLSEPYLDESSHMSGAQE